jgi:hypothetical protein
MWQRDNFTTTTTTTRWTSPPHLAQHSTLVAQFVKMTWLRESALMVST